MIVSRFEGGLGNQLFQYAIGRCLAHKNNTELKLDITDNIINQNSHHAYYRLGEFNINESFATTEDIKNLQVIRERPAITANEIFESTDNVYLNGYWQNEKYFIDIEDILRREFTLKHPLERISNFWKDKITAAECAIALHIRHGDFLHPKVRKEYGIVPIEYYLTCVNELKNYLNDFTVFVFSDDINWAKSNLNLGVPTEFVEGCEHDYEEMYLMSICQHNIIANSTFSWWGAWLNNNPDKKVFMPYPWVNYDHPINEYIFPDKCIRIPVDYEKNLRLNFPPMLSVIFYVEDAPQTLQVTLNSILGQTYKDHELIIIDGSTDDSGKICREFATLDNVTCLRAAKSVDKFKAWNIGLECARGDYVIFIASNDFLLTNTVDFLCKYDFKADIICSTYRIEENPNGNFKINGLDNRNFSVEVDNAFKNLDRITNLSLSNFNKLQMLALQNINSSVGTKFFKRRFLNEHNIRFSENKMGGGTELKFLIDAFWHTEVLTFIPQVFYGCLS